MEAFPSGTLSTLVLRQKAGGLKLSKLLLLTFDGNQIQFAPEIPVWVSSVEFPFSISLFEAFKFKPSPGFVYHLKLRGQRVLKFVSDFPCD